MSMIVNTPPPTFEVPSEGSHQATLLDILDIGNVETKFGSRHKLKFIFAVTENGKALEVHVRYNWTLHEKSALRKMLKSWLRRDPGTSFDLEPLKGRRATIIIQHAESEGRTFGNVISVLPPQDGK